MTWMAAPSAVLFFLLITFTTFPARCEEDESVQEGVQAPIVENSLGFSSEMGAGTYSLSKEYPGVLVGSSAPERLTLFYQGWRFRSMTYEMLFSNSDVMCHAIYGLAIFVGDIRLDISLDRFVAGVKGFHYPVTQLVDWLNAMKSGSFKWYDQEEKIFERRLVDGGVIRFDSGTYVSTGMVRHVLGAAQGKKRSLLRNLTHERFHIVWDEDESFRIKWLGRWRALDDGERARIASKFLGNGYSVESDMGVAEEWAVSTSDQCNIQHYDPCDAQQP